MRSPLEDLYWEPSSNLPSLSLSNGEKKNNGKFKKIQADITRSRVEASDENLPTVKRLKASIKQKRRITEKLKEV